MTYDSLYKWVHEAIETMQDYVQTDEAEAYLYFIQEFYGARFNNYLDFVNDETLSDFHRRYVGSFDTIEDFVFHVLVQEHGWVIPGGGPEIVLDAQKTLRHFYKDFYPYYNHWYRKAK